MTVVRTRFGGDVEMRLFESISNIPSPGTVSYPATIGSQPAIAIAAVSTAVRLVSESIGGFVPRVYRGSGTERQPINGWQAELLEHPSPHASSFDFWSDVSVSLELYSNAVILKRRSGNRVVELEVVPPEWLSIEKDPKTGTKVIKAHIGGQQRDITADALHIRSWSPDATTGVSTTALHSKLLNTAQQYETFKGAFFSNGAQPGVVLSHPGQPSLEQRQEILDSWVARHGDARNSYKPGLVWGGMEVTPIQGSMSDAQGTQVGEAIVKDVARIFRIYPPDLLHTQMSTAVQESASAWADTFVRFSLMPRMRRIERAFSGDADLFPDRARYLRFDVGEFDRAGIGVTSSVAHQLTQVGVITKNEARAMLGLPRLPSGGDTVQDTPVGGAVNRGMPEPGQ